MGENTNSDTLGFGGRGGKSSTGTTTETRYSITKLGGTL